MFCCIIWLWRQTPNGATPIGKHIKDLTTGLEPTTTRSWAKCFTDWAIEGRHLPSHEKVNTFACRAPLKTYGWMRMVSRFFPCCAISWHMPEMEVNLCTVNRWRCWTLDSSVRSTVAMAPTKQTAAECVRAYWELKKQQMQQEAVDFCFIPYE